MFSHGQTNLSIILRQDKGTAFNMSASWGMKLCSSTQHPRLVFVPSGFWARYLHSLHCTHPTICPYFDTTPVKLKLVGILACTLGTMYSDNIFPWVPVRVKLNVVGSTSKLVYRGVLHSSIACPARWKKIAFLDLPTNMGNPRYLSCLYVAFTPILSRISFVLLSSTLRLKESSVFSRLIHWPKLKHLHRLWLWQKYYLHNLGNHIR